MSVIVLASSKGGVGKSTIALVLAHALAHAGGSVALIDADPNSPMDAWAKLSGGNLPERFTLNVGVSEDSIIEKIDEASERDSFVIVDLEGSANMAVSYAIGRADLVLVPLQGSQLDANEAAKVIRLIEREARAYRRKIPYAAILSRTSFIKPRTAKHIESEIRGAGIDILPVEMTERDAFKALFSFGGTLYDLTSEEVSSPDKACANAEALAQAVIDHLRGLKDA
ncbi:ParA family protein [Palleronia caenipelagi]|uniref:ParA family protein n=1 Tax=Palleronia caenipelagi TaxID=2489174 RepID=A0A547PMW4_9RHOB|nr:ParA family protein [Palleronia caenipelagi]TRD15463.1 ParA family protein [Palleronia caenipelagi]